ncbi:acyl-CoA dehydratase activase-related protein [Sporolituus thermophilus]|uniref:Predicted nucleotide-binding protein, sugar kinase/HSP70/actin superfamily n=1 Tax=Sporolituus thermophilus DSM 23256 TaxID=1123285 RepID=A0A1G7IRV8_9FIRM|nr:acyl-CoA dehydratase activase-related protein [Sporolituus thermophilus]SDF15460.1 Predicted nucleotide-binding protein, sugar kinase/HSP70/actin superfamily [Sporolituus thermophilus DSM 23256]
MKIGLPRALLYYYYNPLWQNLFTNLGCEAVLSGPTTKEIVDLGVKYSVAEICLPLKIFCGHVASLLNTGVDYIFIPRMVSVEKHKFFCPKFLGLPDMMRHILPELAERMLAPDICCRRETIEDFGDYAAFARPLGVSSGVVKKALAAAISKWTVFRRYHLQGCTIEEALARLESGPASASPPPSRPLTIGLLGYVYNIYDKFIGMDIIGKLRAAGANVVTFEMLDDYTVTENLRPLRKTMPWTFTNKLLGTGYDFFDDPRIDGVIHITAFGCGPDSMLGKMLDLIALEKEKAFMTIRVDEHSGEAHLNTRIEAFVDMLRRKKMLIRQAR